jgi:branched-chain amino acid aminotransferase
MKYAYQNGKIKETKKIEISPYDLGFLRGYAVFDVSRTKESGDVFLIKEHYKRIKNSAKKIGLNFNLSENDFKNIIEKLKKKNKTTMATVRTIVSGGESKSKFNFEGNENIIILMEDLIMNKKEDFEKGLSVITLEYKREFPEIKTTNYLCSIQNQKNQKKAKSFETIYIKNNQVFEASTANVFIVKNKKIFTAKDGVLMGITRNLIIKLAKKNNFSVLEKNISKGDLFGADEVFLTATNKNVLPIIRVDKKKIGNGKVGDVTKSLIRIFEDFEKRY